MWTPWKWAVLSQEAAVSNARAAATELAQRRVDVLDAEIYLERHPDTTADSRSA